MVPDDRWGHAQIAADQQADVDRAEVSYDHVGAEVLGERRQEAGRRAPEWAASTATTGSPGCPSAAPCPRGRHPSAGRPGGPASTRAPGQAREERAQRVPVARDCRAEDEAPRSTHGNAVEDSVGVALIPGCDGCVAALEMARFYSRPGGPRREPAMSRRRAVRPGRLKIRWCRVGAARASRPDHGACARSGRTVKPDPAVRCWKKGQGLPVVAAIGIAEREALAVVARCPTEAQQSKRRVLVYRCRCSLGGQPVEPGMTAPVPADVHARVEQSPEAALRRDRGRRRSFDFVPGHEADRRVGPRWLRRIGSGSACCRSCSPADTGAASKRLPTQ